MKRLNSLCTLYFCHQQSAFFRRVNFWSKDQLTKKKDLILIKDLISNKWKFKQKQQGWFHSQEYIYIYIFLPIFRKARPSFLRVLHIMKRLSQDVTIWKLKNSVHYDTIIEKKKIKWTLKTKTVEVVIERYLKHWYKNSINKW